MPGVSSTITVLLSLPVRLPPPSPPPPPPLLFLLFLLLLLLLLLLLHRRCGGCHCRIISLTDLGAERAALT